jgi:glycosyltransferase involved in cell wall biosynthesis
VKILFNAERLSSDGGVEMSVFQVSQELATRGHQLHLLYMEDGNLSDDYRSFCQSVVRVPTFEFWRRNGLRSATRLVPGMRQGRRVHPDVVYINRFPDVTFGVLTGWAARARVVCHLRFISAHRPTRLMGSRIRRFIAVSHAQRDQWIRAGLEPEWVDVVYNGINPDAYPPGGADERRRARERMGLPADAFVVLYCGRLSPEKGIEVLLEAWRQLALDPSDARLVLLGDSLVPSRSPEVVEYQQEVHRTAPPGCDWLPMRRDVVTPMHAADALVLPSHLEPFGRVVIEALATGRPIVASRVDGIPEILTGPFERFLFPDGDASALADRLTSLRGWQEREPSLAAACVEHVGANFTLQKTVDGIERVLVDAAASG